MPYCKLCKSEVSGEPKQHWEETHHWLEVFGQPIEETTYA